MGSSGASTTDGSWFHRPYQHLLYSSRRFAGWRRSIGSRIQSSGGTDIGGREQCFRTCIGQSELSVMTTTGPKQSLGVALVTGASSGIGESIALELNRVGFTTYAAARRVDVMEHLANNGIRVLRLDLSDSLSIYDCVETVRRESGRVDVLVNNAGYGLYGLIEEVSLEEAPRAFPGEFLSLGE